MRNEYGHTFETTRCYMKYDKFEKTYQSDSQYKKYLS